MSAPVTVPPGSFSIIAGASSRGRHPYHCAIPDRHCPQRDQSRRSFPRARDTSNKRVGRMFTRHTQSCVGDHPANARREKLMQAQGVHRALKSNGATQTRESKQEVTRRGPGRHTGSVAVPRIQACGQATRTCLTLDGSGPSRPQPRHNPPHQ